MIWHSNTIQDVLQELQVDAEMGLTQQEADARLKEYGKNDLGEQHVVSFRQTFAKQIRSPLTTILWLMVGATLLMDLYNRFLKQNPTDWKRSLIVAAFALAITLLNTIRHRRAISATATLRSLSVPDTRVRRDGTERFCPAPTLVPGDVILLSAGDLVPADCRIIEAKRLRCDECELTEATMPTEKNADAVFDDITPLAQRTNMLYAGTAITAGTATAVVVATGTRSEMGRHPTQVAQTALPTQKSINRLILWLNGGCVALCLLYLVIGLIGHNDRSAILLMSASLAMATIPQGMTALFALLTTRSIQRMSRHHLLFNRPEAAQTLGRVTLLCTEQETLHQGDNLYLCRAFVSHRSVDITTASPKAPGLEQLIRLSALNTHDASNIDSAILAVLPKWGIDKSDLLVDMPRIGELPSTDTRRTAIHLAGEQALTLVSGDWRSLLPLCTNSNMEEWITAAEAMERDGLQVWAVTYRLTDTAPALYTAEALEQDLTCAGLLGLCVPLHVVSTHATPQVRTILFSTESPAIASAAARSAGLTTGPCAATAKVIDGLTDEELLEAVTQYNIYCGLSVTQKQRVLTTLQRHDVVLFTAGDSTEAELLTTADVGCARGTVAADVTKEAADIILTDDSFSAVVNAVREGRRLRIEHIGMTVYLTVCAIAMLVVGYGSLLGWFSMAMTAVLLLGLHLFFLALPLPLWIVRGISHVVHSVSQKA